RDGSAMVWATVRIWRNVHRLESSRSTRQSGATGDLTAQRRLEADSDHWWFRTRSSFVATALRRSVLPSAENAWLVDVGAGSGVVTAKLGWSLDRAVALEASSIL